MNSNEAAGPLAEYAALRGEIDSRSKFQQQIFALQLTLGSAIFSFGLSRSELLGILLIVPLSTYLLCGRYVGQRTAIHLASSYIIDTLSARIPGGLGWSSWRLAQRRRNRAVEWLVPMLISFPGASSLALCWTAPLVFGGWADLSGVGLADFGLAAIWVTGVFAAGASAYLLVRVYVSSTSK